MLPASSRRDYGEDILVFWSFTHHVRDLRRDFRGPLGHLAGMDDEHVLGWTFENHLAPRAETGRRIDSFLSRFLSGPMLGVHLRYADKKGRRNKILRHADRKTRKNDRMGIYLAPTAPGSGISSENDIAACSAARPGSLRRACRSTRIPTDPTP